jgi:hypothetical protein
MINKPKRLLYLSFVQYVGMQVLRRGNQKLVALLADLHPGIHVLADLDRLESMDVACEGEFGKAMELCNHHGVELVFRLIPDPTKDSGLNILSVFHYRHSPRVVTQRGDEPRAARLLGL